MNLKKIGSNRWVTDLTDEDISGEIFQGLVDCYRAVFNAKGEHEWGENWTEERTISHITQFVNCRDDNRRFICAILTDSEVISRESIIGFIFGLVLSDMSQLTRAEMPFHLPDEEKDTAIEFLRNSFPDMRHFIFMHELGIRKDKRKGLRQLAEMVRKIIASPCAKKALTMFFWTSKYSLLYNLVRGSGAGAVYSFNDERLVVLFKYDLIQLRGLTSGSIKCISTLLCSTLSKWKN